MEQKPNVSEPQLLEEVLEEFMKDYPANLKGIHAEERGRRRLVTEKELNNARQVFSDIQARRVAGDGLADDAVTSQELRHEMWSRQQELLTPEQ